MVTESSTHHFLEQAGAELASHPAVQLECSIRLRPEQLETRGRLSCWISGKDPDDFLPLARVLTRLAAPTVVCQAQQHERSPLRQGISISVDETGTSYRLYLHGRRAITQTDTYEAWRWRPQEEPQKTHYTFHYFPETTEGLQPQDVCPASLRAPLALLLAEDRFQQISGFWLRKNAVGTIDQLDLAFPWSPAAASLRGLRAVAERFHLEADARWQSFPVRHIAFLTHDASPSVTLYAAAPLVGPWPQTETDFQHHVFHFAQEEHHELEQRLFARLPELGRDPPKDRQEAHFYDGELSTWQTLLGEELHYHFGIFDDPSLTADDAQMDVALRRAVTELYPLLPAGQRIYDVGCGWGGPLAMWSRDLGCPSLGITNSRTQFRFAAARGLPVRLGDAERTLPPGRFACAVLLESLSHIREKARLLRVLRAFSERLVMRVNCQDTSPPGSAFGGSMHMISSMQLQQLLKETGWRTRHFVDRRLATLPSIAVWHRRLRSIPMQQDQHDPHLAALRVWTDRVLRFPLEWARRNPLMEVIAD